LDTFVASARSSCPVHSHWRFLYLCDVVIDYSITMGLCVLRCCYII
jgi:hypothetical protein